jgi:hypothetical protein
MRMKLRRWMLVLGVMGAIGGITAGTASAQCARVEVAYVCMERPDLQATMCYYP